MYLLSFYYVNGINWVFLTFYKVLFFFESNYVCGKIKIIFFKAPESRKKVVTAKPGEPPKLEPPPAKGT